MFSRRNTRPQGLTNNLSEVLAERDKTQMQTSDVLDQEIESKVKKLIGPHTGDVARECAEVYLRYVKDTGNTSCLDENVTYRMRELLWEAYRRAGIKREYPDVSHLPSLVPYFVDTVRLLNRHERPQNHVAFFCVSHAKTGDIQWFIALKDPDKRRPGIALNKNEVVVETLY